MRPVTIMLLVLFAPFTYAQLPDWELLINYNPQVGGGPQPYADGAANCQASAEIFFGSSGTGTFSTSGSTAAGNIDVNCFQQGAFARNTGNVQCSEIANGANTDPTYQNCLGYENPVSACLPLEGTITSQGFYEIGTDSNANPVINACINSCVHSFTGESPAARALVNGTFVYYAQGEYTNEGEDCTAQPNAPSADPVPPDTCPPGEVLGSFNGVPTCAGTDGEPNNPNAPIPAGSTTTTDPVDNGDGTSTKTETTTGADGSTSTRTIIINNGTGEEQSSTTTVTSGFGTDPLTMETEGNDLTEFCSANPMAALCQESSASTSACTGTPSCSGDAIQCAQLQTLHDIKCQAEDPTVTGTTDCAVPPVCSGDAIGCEIIKQNHQTQCQYQVPEDLTSSDETALALAANPGGQTLQGIATATVIDASDPLGGYVPNITAACPAPLTFEFLDTTFSITFQFLCDWATLIRVLVLALGYIIVAFIYYRGLVEGFN